ncbi:MAG: hypothetical protein JWM80_5841 [Cyanobacteria bacterium RYN_339]|nr:hypothetical protein [Cyanobacteria bacterium RYN_339]
MSNWFGTSPTKPEGRFQATNGATDVLLAVLCLAGAPLAQTPQQIRLMVWLAGQDQTLIGRGVAGFDLCDLPWERPSFAADRAFLLVVAAAAKTRVGWDRLGYTPPPEPLEENLDLFAALAAALEPGDVAWDDDRSPILGWPETIRLCPRHDAYEHAHGCLLCNDV